MSAPSPCPGPAGAERSRAERVPGVASGAGGAGLAAAALSAGSRAAARTPRERQSTAGCSPRPQPQPLARQPHAAPAGLMPLAHLRVPSFPGGLGCRCCISLRAAGRNGKRLQEKPSEGRAQSAAPAAGRRRSPRRIAAPRSPGSGRRSTAQPRLTSPPRLRGCAAAAAVPAPTCAVPPSRALRCGGSTKAALRRGGGSGLSPGELPAPLHQSPVPVASSHPLPSPAGTERQPTSARCRAAPPFLPETVQLAPSLPSKAPSPAPVLRLLPALRSAPQPEEVPRSCRELRGTRRPTYSPPLTPPGLGPLRCSGKHVRAAPRAPRVRTLRPMLAGQGGRRPPAPSPLDACV